MDPFDLIADAVAGRVSWWALYNAGLLALMVTAAIKGLLWMWNRDPPF